MEDITAPKSADRKILLSNTFIEFFFFFSSFFLLFLFELTFISSSRDYLQLTRLSLRTSPVIYYTDIFLIELASKYSVRQDCRKLRLIMDQTNANELHASNENYFTYVDYKFDRKN